MSRDLTKELLALKQQIEGDKEKKARLEGRLASLLDRLKSEFGCSSIKEAEKKLAGLQKEIEQLSGSIQEKVDGIKRQYAG
jgi:predicted  nucleic acid-binding Zn-ribbon protein